MGDLPTEDPTSNGKLGVTWVLVSSGSLHHSSPLQPTIADF